MPLVNGGEVGSHCNQLQWLFERVVSVPVADTPHSVATYRALTSPVRAALSFPDSVPGTVARAGPRPVAAASDAPLVADVEDLAAAALAVVDPAVEPVVVFAAGLAVVAFAVVETVAGRAAVAEGTLCQYI